MRGFSCPSCGDELVVRNELVEFREIKSVGFNGDLELGPRLSDGFYTNNNGLTWCATCNKQITENISVDNRKVLADLIDLLKKDSRLDFRKVFQNLGLGQEELGDFSKLSDVEVKCIIFALKTLMSDPGLLKNLEGFWATPV